MEAIWMIIVIVVLVLQAVSKVSGPRGQRPRRWEPVNLPGQGRTKEPKQPESRGLPPVLKDWGYPWDEPQWGEPAPKEEFSQDERQRPEQQEEVGLGLPSPAALSEKREAFNQGDPVEYRPELSLSREDLLNGLIVSELLQPPKSRRKR